ncbi:MAG: CBS domain-containing protein, partial [Microgenomates group bacterium]
CLYHPPKVHINDPLTKVAQFFIETKVHYLPVFDDKDQFLGIISARRLLSRFEKETDFKVKIEEILKNKKPLTVIYENDSVASALNVFKSTKFSKLVVVDSDFKLKGIFSYFDLIYYLMLPKDSPSKGAREGKKVNFFHQPVKNFMKTYVLTLTKENYLSEALHLILEKKIGSVVILGEKRKPAGIITTRDLLKFFIQKEKEKEKPPVFRRFFKGIFPQESKLLL